jgi:acetyltransferase-like isoleucine patch superfamily enzyme
MASTSFENFATDMMLRAYYCHDWLTECLSNLDDEIGRDLAALDKRQRRALKIVFDRMVETIANDVRLISRDGPLKPNSISFHRRFGWVVEIGTCKAFLGKLTLLEGVRLSIGPRSYFSGPSTIRGVGEVEIGAYCSIAEGAYINSFRDFHPMSHSSSINFRDEARLIEDGLAMEIDYPEFHTVRNQIRIGNDVWIGRHCHISYDTTIGDGCVIAESSLVRKDCEPYGIYAGTPAKLVRYRFSEKIREQLLECRWWDWPYDRIQRNQEFFATLMTEFDGKIDDIID